MGSSVRHMRLLVQRVGWPLYLALVPMGALAQTPSKEPFPFDWLRHDAAPTNRAAGSPFSSPVGNLNEQKKGPQIEPAMEDPQAIAAPVETPEASPAQADVEARPGIGAPAPIARPVPHAAKTKPSQPMDEVDVVNNRSVTLNELKLVSLKEGRKPFIVRPSLKPGQRLTVEIPREWGCLFIVWTQFSEEPSEQFDGVDLCGDRTINLVN